jgi:carbamoyl-phosphate synthase large subunit
MTEPVGVTVAVTGMNATDNPAPGVAVCRSLRAAPGFEGRIIGLGYEALDPGFYADGLLDGGAILPYPSVGRAATVARLAALKKEFGIDVVLPTLDSELRPLAAAGEQLADLELRAFTPTLESLQAVSKAQLAEEGKRAGFPVPDSTPLMSAEGVSELVDRLGLPIVIKGVFYGAAVAYSEADAIAAFHHHAAKWGLPVIGQRFIEGEEYDVAALGDGRGNTIGAVPMRKMALTEQGKAWSGVTIEDPAMLDLTRQVIAALGWRGGLEVEILKERTTGKLYVAEINPRFPAWVHLTTGAGQNLPFACVELALGRQVEPLPPYRVGVQFVRISLDQISDMTAYAALSAAGSFSQSDKPGA